MDENYIFLTSVTSLLTPWIMDIFNGMFAERIAKEQVRKSVIFLGQLIISFLISAAINWLGDFNMSLKYIALMGTGVSLPAGMLAYRARKLNNG